MPAPVIAKPCKGLWQSVSLRLGTDSHDQSSDWSRNDGSFHILQQFRLQRFFLYELNHFCVFDCLETTLVMHYL